jgi:hypothetical protein
MNQLIDLLLLFDIKIVLYNYIIPAIVVFIGSVLTVSISSLLNIVVLFVISYIVNINSYNMTTGCPLNNETCSTQNRLRIYRYKEFSILLEYGLSLFCIEVITILFMFICSINSVWLVRKIYSLHRQRIMKQMDIINIINNEYILNNTSNMDIDVNLDGNISIEEENNFDSDTGDVEL